MPVAEQAPRRCAKTSRRSAPAGIRVLSASRVVVVAPVRAKVAAALQPGPAETTLIVELRDGRTATFPFLNKLFGGQPPQGNSESAGGDSSPRTSREDKNGKLIEV